jgi:protein NrfC
MSENEERNDEEAYSPQSGLSRRQFVTGLGGIGLGAVLGGVITGGLAQPASAVAIEGSEGYLVVDGHKCIGCDSCMMACSLTHHGNLSFSQSRIQITQNPFALYPDDLTVAQCRQCPFPACVEVCPTGACHVDAANGNVRTVDASKCIGCERCVDACPFTPSRAIWNGIEKHAEKCDLCADTPFWNEKGGAGGKQACITVCHMKAITLQKDVPVQSGDVGYNVNLRTKDASAMLKLPTGNDGFYTPAEVAAAKAAAAAAAAAAAVKVGH